jgi:hypothetical protein
MNNPRSKETAAPASADPNESILTDVEVAARLRVPPVNVSKSLVDGYQLTTCQRCGLPAYGKTPQEYCERVGCVSRQHLFDDYPMAWLALAIIKGEFKATRHTQAQPIVLYENELLRFVFSPDGRGYWEPQPEPKLTEDETKRYDAEQVRAVWNRRLNKTVQKAPCWAGEPRPDGESIPLESVFASVEDWARLRNNLRKIHTGELLPWKMRKLGRSQKKLPCPPHVIPFTPKHNFTPSQVTATIAKRRWDDSMIAAVYDVIYHEKPCRSVALERQIHAPKLSHYVWQVRKELRSDAY